MINMIDDYFVKTNNNINIPILMKRKEEDNIIKNIERKYNSYRHIKDEYRFYFEDINLILKILSFLLL